MAGAGAAVVAALTAGLLAGLPGPPGTHHSTRVTARTAAYVLKRAAAQAVTQSGQPAPRPGQYILITSAGLSMTDGGARTTGSPSSAAGSGGRPATASQEQFAPPGG
jgi:hypothetical protein